MMIRIVLGLVLAFYVLDAARATPITDPRSIQTSAVPAPAPADQKAEPGKPGWMTDPSTDCRVWNPYPVENESVEFAGTCRNGFAEGHGVLQWFEHGKPTARYEGEFRGGKANGFGTMSKPAGISYYGDWKDFKAHGAGHFVTPEYNYSGLWEEGCANDGAKRYGVGRVADSCP